MVAGTIDEKRIEEAVRRLPVLPERKGDVSRAVTGLLYVIKRAALKTEDEAASEQPEQEEVDETRLVAAKELRETHWLFYDFREGWANLSDKARDALKRRMRKAGLPNTDFDELIDRMAQLLEPMATAADDLEEPERPAAAPKPDDPPLLIAQHAARMYTRLTGKTLPKPKGKDGVPRGPFFWLLEDVFAGAGIIASADQYSLIIAQG
jgi:hypothetical protein